MMEIKSIIDSNKYDGYKTIQYLDEIFFIYIKILISFHFTLHQICFNCII